MTSPSNHTLITRRICGTLRMDCITDRGAVKPPLMGPEVDTAGDGSGVGREVADARG